MRKLGPIFFKKGREKSSYRRKLLGMYEQLTENSFNKFFANKKRRADGTIIRSIGIPTIGGMMLYKSYITEIPEIPTPAPTVCYEFAFLTGIATHNMVFPDLTIWDEVTDFDENWNAGSCNWYNLDGSLIISWAPQSRRYFTNGGTALYCKNEAILKDDGTQLVAPTSIKGAAFNSVENLLYVAGYVDEYVAVYKISATHDRCGVVTASGDWELIADGIWEGKGDLEDIEDGRGFWFNASATQIVFLTDFYKMIVCDVTSTSVDVNQVYNPVLSALYTTQPHLTYNYEQYIQYDKSGCALGFPDWYCENIYYYQTKTGYKNFSYTADPSQLKSYIFADFKGDDLVYAYATRSMDLASYNIWTCSSSASDTNTSSPIYQFTGTVSTNPMTTTQADVEFYNSTLPRIVCRGVSGQTTASYSYGPTTTNPTSVSTIYSSSIETNKFDVTDFDWHYLDLRHDYACFIVTGTMYYPVQPDSVRRYSGYRISAMKGTVKLLEIDLTASDLGVTVEGDEGRTLWSNFTCNQSWWVAFGLGCSCSDSEQGDDFLDTGTYDDFTGSSVASRGVTESYTTGFVIEDQSILFSSLPDESAFFVCGRYARSGYHYIGDLYVNGELVADLSANQFSYPRLIQTDKRA